MDSDYEELKKRNKYLEELCYNTERNSGKNNEENDRDELIALRNEFKNLVQINAELRKQMQPQTPCCYYFCAIL